MDDQVFALFPQDYQVFWLDLSQVGLKGAFLFNSTIRHGEGNRFIHFEWNNIFFTHLWNKKEDFPLLIHTIKLLNNNNPQKNYDQTFINLKMYFVNIYGAMYSGLPQYV